ncbi:hypothetical protein VNO80_28408 [Phaseolus coccineus]|uniref:Fructose-1-6-bisphosphatase class I N-terminal domain-containing protein n=1 Tax=Phaseolus coccineus TaxID=3886 RepID=A0AAN9QDZ1_PHACN
MPNWFLFAELRLVCLCSLPIDSQGKGSRGTKGVRIPFVREEQRKLDVLSNEVFVKALSSSGRTFVLVYEEVEEAIFVLPSHRGKSVQRSRTN